MQFIAVHLALSEFGESLAALIYFGVRSVLAPL